MDEQNITNATTEAVEVVEEVANNNICENLKFVGVGITIAVVSEIAYERIVKPAISKFKAKQVEKKHHVKTVDTEEATDAEFEEA